MRSLVLGVVVVVVWGGVCVCGVCVGGGVGVKGRVRGREEVEG